MSFSRILLTTQCIQNISNNLREVDLKKSSAWRFFWWEIYVRKHLCFWFQKVAKFMRSKKLELKLNIGFGCVVFFHKFYLWYSMLRKAGQKSSHHIYLSHPHSKNLHKKAGQKSSSLIFYAILAFTWTAP